jgi:hypothetical protein
MLTYGIIAVLVVIPAISFALSRFCPRCVYRLALSLIALGLLSFLMLFVASKTGLPLNPYLLVTVGVVSFFAGMSMCMGFGIWKLTCHEKQP